MIRYALAIAALLAFFVILYGAYALYEYKSSVHETEHSIEGSEIQFVPAGTQY